MRTLILSLVFSAIPALGNSTTVLPSGVRVVGIQDEGRPEIQSRPLRLLAKADRNRQARPYKATPPSFSSTIRYGFVRSVRSSIRHGLTGSVRSSISYGR